MIDDKILYNTLQELKIIPADTLTKLYKESVKAKVSFSTLLLKKELITDENLGQIIADLMGTPFVSLSKTAIPNRILSIVPEEVAKKEFVIIFDQDKDGFKLATPNPENKEMFEMLSRKTGHKINVYYATQKDLEDTLNLYKKDLQRTFNQLIREGFLRGDSKEDDSAPITKILDLLLESAFDDKASDIHIEPEEDKSVVRFRIDGVLHDVLNINRDLHDQIISRIKVLSRLRTDEHLSAQDGKMRFETPRENLDIRVSIVPIVNGEKSVLRLLSSTSRQFSLIELGISGKDLEKVKRGFLKPYGMILATGPTGSGKTTSIYAILKILNTREKNIATIEDPVEYDIDGVNQIQVNAKTNLTFAEGLKSILRQDPDIIFVGEIRDEDTADIAINSAMTGHLVLSTLHTNDAATSLPRLIDMKIEPFLVASTVNIIIAQRLVRRICNRCRVSYIEDREKLASLFDKVTIDKSFSPTGEIRLYHGKGCLVCHHTGYVGRVGIFEVLEVNEEIRKLIDQKVDSDVIKGQAIKEGMITMLEDGLNKVKQGITTLEEVLRATRGCE